MIETFGWLAVVAGAVGVAALLLLLIPPSQRAVRAWLSRSNLRDDDQTVTAVRGALMRMCYAGGAVLLAFTVAGLMAEFKAVSAALGLAIAAVAAASVGVDGGSRRRADLGHLEVADARAGRLLTGATVLSAVVCVVAVVLAVFYARRSESGGSPVIEAGSLVPVVEHFTLPLVAGVSALLAVAAWLGYRRVLRRQSLAGVDTNVDHALRAISTRRIAAGALSAQIILLGTALTGVPLLAQSTVPVVEGGAVWQVDQQLVNTAGGVALVVVVVGLVVAAASLASPFRVAAVRQLGHAPAERA